MITLRRFRRLERAVHEAGHAEDSVWAEELLEPTTPRQFARSVVYVIVNSGMKYAVAQGIFDRCLKALNRSGNVRRVFGHTAKARAIDWIWANRRQLF